MIEGRYFTNGFKNVYAKAAGEGSPAVIIEPGWGVLSVEWTDIQTEIAKHTACITYDRPGYGESPKGEKPRSARQIAVELFNFLINSEIQRPYIFIAHSMGGLYIQQFAKMFPHFVEGIIFVDSMTIHEREFDKLEAPNFQQWASITARAANIRNLAEMDKETFEKYIHTILQNLYDGVPEILKQQLLMYQSDKNFLNAILDEYEAFDESLELLKATADFPNIPVKVLTRDFRLMIEISKQIGIPEEEARVVEELWLNNSKELAAISPQGEFAVVQGSTHSMHQTAPDAIINATLEMLKSFQKPEGNSAK